MAHTNEVEFPLITLSVCVYYSRTACCSATIITITYVEKLNFECKYFIYFLSHALTQRENL